MGVQGKVLIVDDEREALENCRRILSRLRYECLTECDPLAAVSTLERERPGLVLTDLRMPGMDGIDLLQAAKRVDPDIQVVLLTAYASVETAVSSMRHGAFDYLTKPFSSTELEDVARRAFGGVHDPALHRQGALDSQGQAPARPREARAPAIIGKSPAMEQTLTLVRRAAPTMATVLIYGESGTGKELIARAIHQYSSRADRPFVPVDCAALPDTLLESELFGHEKGAFTGAHVAKPGLFELADGGTVFLDEVGAMSELLQSRLLRVLQERQVRRVGGTRVLDVDIRIVAASNRDLEEACRKHEFRSDLFYRLNVIQISLPPLRERLGDVPLLAEEFLRRYAGRVGAPLSSPRAFHPEALVQLARYHWPGNVRELQNVVERAAALTDGSFITVEDLPERIRAGYVGDEGAASGEPSSNGGNFKRAKQAVLHTFERRFLIDLLKRHHGHMSRAAKEAGVDRKTIERLVKRHGLRGLI